MAGSPDIEDEQHVETSPNGRYIRYSAVLGRGAYKTVYKAFDTEEALEVAWNKLHVDRLTDYDLEKVSNEVSLLRQVEHKNIIRFYDTWHVGDANGNQTINFITEQMISGTLKEYLKKAKAIKLKVIRRWCRNILEAIAYLHSRKPPIMHRDLKCDNIFINGHVGEVKIGDLGLSGVKERDKAESVIGTPEFMAPELYEESYTEKVDIYAFGMCLLEIVTMEYPYSECNNMAQIFKKVFNGEKPKAYSSLVDGDVKDVIESCLEREANRPSAAELLDHPLFKYWDNDPGNISNLSLVKGVEDSMQGTLSSTLHTSQSSNAMPIGTELIDWSDPLKRSVLVSMKEGGETSKEGEEQQVSVVAAKDNGEFYIGLEIPIRDAIKRVEFSFDPFEDSSQHIAQEMVSEFRLGQEQLEVIRAEIDRQVQHAKEQREAASRHATPTPPPRSAEQRDRAENNPSVTSLPVDTTVTAQPQVSIPHVQQPIPTTMITSVEPYTPAPLDPGHPSNMPATPLPDPHGFTTAKSDLPRPPEPLPSAHGPPGGNVPHKDTRFTSEAPLQRLGSHANSMEDQPLPHRAPFNNSSLASDQHTMGNHPSTVEPPLSVGSDMHPRDQDKEHRGTMIDDHTILPSEPNVEEADSNNRFNAMDNRNISIAHEYDVVDREMNVNFVSEGNIGAMFHDKQQYDKRAPIVHDYPGNPHVIHELDSLEHAVKGLSTALTSSRMGSSAAVGGNALTNFASHVPNSAEVAVHASSAHDKSFDNRADFAPAPPPLSSQLVSDYQNTVFGRVSPHKAPDDMHHKNAPLHERQGGNKKGPEPVSPFIRMERTSEPLNSVRSLQVGNPVDDLKGQRQSTTDAHRNVGGDYTLDLRGDNSGEKVTAARDESNTKGSRLENPNPSFHELDSTYGARHSVPESTVQITDTERRSGEGPKQGVQAASSVGTANATFEHTIEHETSSSAGFGHDDVAAGLLASQPRDRQVGVVGEIIEKQSGKEDQDGNVTITPTNIPRIVVVSNEPTPGPTESDRPRRRLTEGSISLTEGSVDSSRSTYGATSSGDYGGRGKRSLTNTQDQTARDGSESYNTDTNLREGQFVTKTKSGDHGQGNTWVGTQESNSSPSANAKTDDQGNNAKIDKSIKKCLKLMSLCAHGRYDDVKSSLLNGSSATFRDYDRRTPLHVAAVEGHANVCALLIENGAEISAKDRWGNTALSDAYDNNKVDVVELLKRHGADDGDDDVEDLEMLHFCAVGDVNAVRNALTGGADVSYVDYDKRSALHVACSEGHAEVAEVLLLNGAPPDAVDRKKRTPVDDAITNGHRDVLRILKRYGAKIPRHKHETDGYHLHCLGVELIEESAKGNERDVKQCLDYGADVNFKHYDKRTALHLACVEGHLEIVQILLDAGAETDVEDRWGNTPLEEAAAGGWREVIDILKQAQSRMADGLRSRSDAKDSGDFLRKHGESSDSIAYYALPDGFPLADFQHVFTDDYVTNYLAKIGEGVNLEGTPATGSLPVTPFDHGSERFEDKKSDEHKQTQNFADIENNGGNRAGGWARDDLPGDPELLDASLGSQSNLLSVVGQVPYSPSLLSVSSICNGPETASVINNEGGPQDQPGRTARTARTVSLFDTQSGTANSSLGRDGLERSNILDAKADVRTLVEGLIKTVVDAAAGG